MATSAARAEPLPPVTAQLAAYWALDGNWNDSLGQQPLVPILAGGFHPSGNGYGPTGHNDQNGAVGASGFTFDRSAGVTIAGWVRSGGGSSYGQMFGFGGDWSEAKLHVKLEGGFIWLTMGRKDAVINQRFSRLDDTCWHHIAVAVAPAGSTGQQIRVYVDGLEQAPTYSEGSLEPAAVQAMELSGAPFRIGKFLGKDGTTQGAVMGANDVGVWTRSLTAAEIASLANLAAVGARCPDAPPPPPPPTPAPTPTPTPQGPLPAVTAQLAGFWALDGNWNDSMGVRPLAPFLAGGFNANGKTYGPTGHNASNGAVGTSAVAFDRSAGVTLAGWVRTGGASSYGQMFGFGSDWGEAKLHVKLEGAFIWLTMGKKDVAVSQRFTRIDDKCWHHVAVVLAPTGSTGQQIRVYIDGIETAPSYSEGALGPAAVQALVISGAPFRIGQFVGKDGTTQGAQMEANDVGFWTRNLSAGEIATLASLSAVGGMRCPAANTAPVVTLPAVTAQLAGFWPLDGNWDDSLGMHPLAPYMPGGFNSSGNGYGPTGRNDQNGAVGASGFAFDRSAGVTIAGWVKTGGSSSNGHVFGFGGDWADAKLVVNLEYSNIWVIAGKKDAVVSQRFARIDDKCWHHIAVVIAPPGSAGQQMRVYLDGVEQTPLYSEGRLDTASFQAMEMSGAPFRIGKFLGKNGTVEGGLMGANDVGVWTRVLTPAEIATLANLAAVGGARCDAPPPPPPPPPPPASRCTFPASVAYTPDLGVRVLDDRNIVLITDPNPWLKARVATDCGTYLRDLDSRKASIADYLYSAGYQNAIKDTIIRYRPPMLASLDTAAHYSVQAGAGAWQAPASAHVWPQLTSEMYFRTLDGTQTRPTDSVEVTYFSYLTLPFAMQNGVQYSVKDAWGNTKTFTYGDTTSQSWSIKVDQLGFMPDAPKTAYLGMWRGPVAGALDLSRFEGSTFEVRRESDNGVAHSGSIVLRGDDRAMNGSGEIVYEMDFSALAAPGRYYVSAAGLGRSRSFDIHPQVLGEAFFVHARGLYHQRCSMDLLPAYTAWPRGDNHLTVYKGGHPPEMDDYRDHAAAGWGFRDANGNYPTYSYGSFTPVLLNATNEALPGIRGGWHDAADYDRGPSHLIAVNNLVQAYLMFPQNFTDGQLNLPESGNGIPDILDEALWGIEVFRSSQLPDGGAGMYFEATSHPLNNNPGTDTQKYYRSLATRNSSLSYAASAAQMGRALKLAGQAARGQQFIDSAVAAYNYAVREAPPQVVSFTAEDGTTHTWTEGPVQTRRRFYALVHLRLATDDAAYKTALETTAMQTQFQSELDGLYAGTESFDLVPILLQPDRFLPDWGARALTAVKREADYWIVQQNGNPYRQLWYRPGQGYFPLMGWGQNVFRPANHQVVAWRFSQDKRYFDAAVRHVNFLYGGNPQGRVNVTGLGEYNVVNPLHLPSRADNIDDPVPGITIYGYTGGGVPAKAVNQGYGLYDDPSAYYNVAGIAKAQLPSPWNDTTQAASAVRAKLYEIMPVWRSLYPLEAANVPQMEFTIPETMGRSTAIIGALMGAGWQPSAALKARGPRTPAQMQQSIWFQP